MYQVFNILVEVDAELKVSVLGPQYEVIDAKYGPFIKVNLHNLFPSRRLNFAH